MGKLFKRLLQQGVVLLGAVEEVVAYSDDHMLTNGGHALHAAL
jgi:hypothetical protein